jgi:hypothetical protein
MIMIIILIYTGIFISIYFSAVNKATAKKLRTSTKKVRPRDDYFSFFKTLAKKH